MTVAGGPAGDVDARAPDHVVLTLYVRGASPHSAAAVDTISRLCDEGRLGPVDLNVVDVCDESALLVQDHILALPTLIRRKPLPLLRLVGHLDDIRRVSIGLELESTPADAGAGRPIPLPGPTGCGQAEDPSTRP